MNVCDNLGDHLVGNVYIKFRTEEDAAKAVADLNNRWFGGRPVYAELSPVTDFREACCREFFLFIFQELSDVKGIKKGIKNFTCPYMDEFLCLLVWIKKLNNFWWTERILMKFLGPVQLCTSNFWVGVSDQLPSRVQPWAINGLFLKIYLLPSFCLTGVGHTFLETLGPVACIIKLLRS
jgi:RNA recognition motif. (a.k.a. RRM, RBD, or RNP domain)